MANMGRKLGVNISASMLEASISLDTFAEKLDYTIKEAWHIIEGRILLSPMELENIAKFLGTTRESLLEKETGNLGPNLQNMNEFSNSENADKILDIMDDYIELREMI